MGIAIKTLGGSSSMKTHLITGASSGLGAEFVKRLGRMYPDDHFLLVARRVEPMLALAKELGIDAECLSMDLERIEDVKKLMDHMMTLTLGDVVLAAGFGKVGTLRENSTEDAMGMIDLNVRALTMLTQAALPRMLRGFTLYLFASVAAFLPQPHFAVYAATKAYVLSFARAISCEEKSNGIHVIAICPNPVETEFFKRAGSKDSVGFVKSIGIETKENVVTTAMRRARRKKDISLSHWSAKSLRFLSRILPHPWILKIEEKIMKF